MVAERFTTDDGINYNHKVMAEDQTENLPKDLIKRPFRTQAIPRKMDVMPNRSGIRPPVPEDLTGMNIGLWIGQPEQISRRQFLTRSALVAGGAALVAGGVYAAQDPEKTAPPGLLTKLLRRVFGTKSQTPGSLPASPQVSEPSPEEFTHLSSQISNPANPGLSEHLRDLGKNVYNPPEKADK